ncbi:hypothetical protein PC123_g17163 [Phytophthora cactorum]|nr:hypothetical protein PC123_g17163 [Phytophthora cactorum]
MVSPGSAKSRPWPSADVRSPIPALTLPPRRLLPPINAMLMANRPGILRRSTPIPPIRSPVVSFERQDQGASREVCKRDPGWQFRAADHPQTPTSSSTRSGYSWQRLQETIRRESRVHGITNEDDESAYEDKRACKVEDTNSSVPTTDGGIYWTRSRGPIPS